MIWPPDYHAEFEVRQKRYLDIEQGSAAILKGAKTFYEARPVEFIEHWCITYDPRNAGSDTSTYMPFILFDRQREFVQFLLDCLHERESGLVEKARDMGATWLCCAFATWLWLFWPGAAIGFGSRKADLVDRLGDASSIFEKIRIILRKTPKFFLPKGFDIDAHANYMKIINPETGSTISGETGDNIGRGGRTLIYFKDESAHYERPEKIEAALADNTNVQIDISSVNGLGNIFHRRREAGAEWTPGVRLPRGKTRVFVFDWRDHPAKTQEWYDTRKQKAMEDGLLHVFKQEVERDYSGSIEGVIIPSEWVAAAIDAHVKLGFGDDGGWCGALDVADGGGDTNALALRKGSVLKHLYEWGAPDTGFTARHAVELCGELKQPVDLQYDCIGVGSGVKAETNRLMGEKDSQGNPLIPRNLILTAWDAAQTPLDPDEFMERLPNGTPDRNSPINKDFYHNLKAQGWWQLRRRFERTYKAIVEGVKYAPDELISLPSTLPLLRKLQKELSQPTAIKSASLKLLVDKQPEGVKSPNLGDAVMMAYWPAKITRPMKVSDAAFSALSQLRFR